MKRAIRIGVTGKMGSGKSTLIQWMEDAGMIALHSDVLAKELMKNDPKLKAGILALLGPKSYTGDELNREYIASKIFSDASLKRQLESIVHPAVRKQIEYVCTNAPADIAVAVESALILHSDLSLAFDYIVLLDASDEVVIGRLLQQGKYDEADIRRRIQEQNYASIRTGDADFIIENNGSLKELEKRSKTVLMILSALQGRDITEVPLHQLPAEEEEG